MKKTLLTLLALVGLTWNVNAQEAPGAPKFSQPPTDEKPPPELGLMIELESGLPLDLYGWLNVDVEWGIRWDIEPLLMAHMIKTKKDKLTLNYYPYRDLKNNPKFISVQDYYSIDISFDPLDKSSLIFLVTRADANEDRSKSIFTEIIAYKIALSGDLKIVGSA